MLKKLTIFFIVGAISITSISLLIGSETPAQAEEECTLSFSPGSGSFTAVQDGSQYHISDIYGGGTLGPEGIVNGTISISYVDRPDIVSTPLVMGREVSAASPDVTVGGRPPNTIGVYISVSGWQLPNPDNPGTFINCTTAGSSLQISLSYLPQDACNVWMVGPNPQNVTGPGDTTQVSLVGNSTSIGTIDANRGGTVNQNGYIGVFTADNSISETGADVSAYGFGRTGDLNGCPTQSVFISLSPDYICPAAWVQLSDDTISVGENVTISAPPGWTGGQFISNSTLNIGNVSGNQAIATGANVGSENITGQGWTASNGATNCTLSGQQITVVSTTPTADIDANSLDALSVPYNTNVTVSWTSVNTSSCLVNPGGLTGTSNTNVPTGNLTANRTYTITCQGSSGGTATDSVTITVGAPPAAADVTCSPGSQSVTAGTSVSFTASPTGGNGGAVLWSAPSGSPASGTTNSFSSTYASAGTYLVTASYEGVSRTCSVTVTAAAVNYPAEGNFVSVGCTSLSGYAFDNNDLNTPVQVKVYESGTSTLQTVSSATASNTLTGYEASKGINGVAGMWNAGDYAEQWYELNLGSQKSVDRLRLQIWQFPTPATTIHKVYAGSSTNPGTLVYTFNQVISSDQWLEATFSPVLTNVQYIRVVSIQDTTNLLSDGSFELPDLQGGTFLYANNISGSGWTLTGDSGISENGSGFTYANPNAPLGTQIGLLQMQNSQIAKTVGLTANTYYIVRFKAAQRSGNSQNFNVYMGPNLVGTVTPSSSTYQELNTTSISGLSGPQTLRFTGINTAGGDNTAFLDDIRLQQINPSWIGWQDTEVYSPGGNNLVGTYTANLASTAVAGYHNFLIPTPNTVKDGNQHSLSVFAVDLQGLLPDAQLTNSPRNVTCVPVSNITSSANKDIIGIRGLPITDWQWNDSEADAHVGVLQPISSDEEIRFAINIWNTGNADFTGTIVVEDTMTNLGMPDSQSWSAQYYCNYTVTDSITADIASTATCSSKFTIDDPTYDGSKITFRLTPKSNQKLAPDDKLIITYKAKTKPPAGSSATVFRFINTAKINGDPPDGTLNSPLQTPAIIFFKDLATPNFLER